MPKWRKINKCQQKNAKKTPKSFIVKSVTLDVTDLPNIKDILTRENINQQKINKINRKSTRKTPKTPNNYSFNMAEKGINFTAKYFRDLKIGHF